MADKDDDKIDLSRRGFLGGAGGLAASGLVVGAVAGAAGAFAVATQSPTIAAVAADAHPFYNQPHQAGIQTEPQKYTVFMTYELTTSSRTDVQVLLARWSAAIAQLAKGDTIGSPQPTRPDAVAQDSGEALDLGPEGLTVTLGLGPGVFDDRFGLSARKPTLLEKIPTLPSDQLQPEYTGGDLSLQACANDPQVAYHAIRNLTRMARGTAATLWTVTGFGRASAGPSQQTPRTLLGFKDGTRNIFEDSDLEKWVWTAGDGQAWMKGGSYMVARKIHMNIETWDTDAIGDQQNVFGRTKLEGAPLSGHREHDTPNFTKKDASGDLVIPATSHIALAAHENNGGVKILRRSYNYTEGIDDLGQIDAGLLFIAYMNDPKHFIEMQTKLGSVDRLNEYIKHIGSAVFAVPPAPKQGSFIAADLFA
ncbi:MAG: peroxidase [Glaciihabitans sp.]|nr:peroxidase [Glaciihabitans sp.]MDQ1569616.1 deferrochelatase/peroxidase EfeB [Actinomycetota bacterium]